MTETIGDVGASGLGYPIFFERGTTDYGNIRRRRGVSRE
jgi:hypothetical protein